MLSYVGYVRSRGRGWAWYVLCAVLFVLALLAKPTPTLLPVGLLLLDIWPLNRFSRRAILEKIPLLILAAVSAWITYESQKRTAIADLPARETWWYVPLVLSHNIVFYLQRFVWPAHPSAHYPMPDVVLPSDPQFAIGMVGTVILIVLLVLSLRRTRAAVVGWLFFFVMIFPATGVIGFANVIAAERFAYLPSVGLMLPLVALIAWAWEQGRSARTVRISIMALAACAAFALGAGSQAYLREWSNTETLFRYMLRLYRKAPSLQLSLGMELEDQGRDLEAMAEYRQTLKLSPRFWIPHMNLGRLLAKNRQLDEGIREYEMAIACKSDFYEAHINLGNALMQNQMLDQALVHYRRAVEIQPNSADAHYNLANALLMTGDTNGAVEQYERALVCDPEHAPTHKNYGTVLLQLGRRSEAVEHYKEALRLRPDWWDVANQLAWIFADRKDPSLLNLPEAVRYAEIACRASKQQQPLPLATLAAMLARSGKTAEARPLAQQAVELARIQSGEAGASHMEKQLRQELDIWAP